MNCLYCAIALKKKSKTLRFAELSLPTFLARTALAYFVVHPSLHECIKAVASILLSFYKLVYNFAETVLRYFGLPVDSGEL